LPNLTDQIVSVYINKIIKYDYYHRRALINKLIKLINCVPNISKKQIVLLLASKNRLEEIDKLIKEFPELKLLKTFV
jgi:hypothetical protein